MATIKITKAQYFKAIAEAVGADFVTTIDDTEVTGADIQEFVEKSLAQLADKATKAKEKAAEKRAESDELRAAVKAVLTEEYQTLADITAQIEGEDLTPAKVTARLTALIKAGEANKKETKVNGKSRMTYALGAAAE